MNGEQQVMRFPENYTFQPTYDLPPGMVPDFFAYQFPVVSNLAAAGTTTVSVQIQRDADFEMRAIGYFFNIANATFQAATRNIPNVTLMLTDTGSGRNLFSNPVPLPTIAFAGDSQNMRLLPWPKIFAINSQVQATIVNFDAAVATGQLYLTLLGRKLFHTR